MTPRRPLRPHTELDSSFLAAFSHDPETRDLSVTMKSGSRYVYCDVSIEKAAALSGAASPGRFFTDRIKGWHVERKLKDGAE